MLSYLRRTQMKIEDEVKKTRKLVNNILIDYHEKIDVKKLCQLTASLCEKRKIFLPKSEIEQVVNYVLDEFYDCGLLAGDERNGFYVDLPNHFSNEKDHRKNIKNLSNRSYQM